MPWTPRFLLLVLLLAVGGNVRAQPDVASTGDLKQLSLEELMDVQVTTVARHPETLLQAPAAIQVITNEDIRRSGASSLAEALRLADNLLVAQKNAHDWGISARGFNTALSNKLLVMIDGRTVYTPLFSGVFWDVQDYLLEDIERIEVISGPGGTLWGANAVNGVINIVTRSAAETQGLYAEAGGGNELQALAGARYGGQLAPDVSFRVYGKYFDRNDEVFPDGSHAGDGWHREQGGFRIDSNASPGNSLSLHGDVYAGHEGLSTGGAAQTAGGNVLGRWTHVISEQSDFSLQTYYDRTHLLDPIPAYFLGTAQIAPAGIAHDDLSTYDIDFQHRFTLAERHRIVWGLGYRFTHDSVENAPGLGFLPTVLDQSLVSAFLQDEIQLATDWSLIVGSKLEHNDYTGFEVEPNIRLKWTLTSSQTLWSAISRAARTPSRIDHDLSEPVPPNVVVLKGGDHYGSEYVTAYELGYRAWLGPRLGGSISTYYNEYRDVRSVSPTPRTVLPLFFANNLAGHTYGAELSATYQLLDAWSLRAGYDFLHESLHVRPGQVDLDNALYETADPEHQFSLRSTLNLPRRLELDAALRWVDVVHTDNGPLPGTVPAYFELDSRLGWHATAHLDLNIVGQNLLHDHHPEYGFPDPARPEIARSVYGKVSWRY